MVPRLLCSWNVVSKLAVGLAFPERDVEEPEVSQLSSLTCCWPKMGHLLAPFLNNSSVLLDVVFLVPGEASSLSLQRPI